MCASIRATARPVSGPAEPSWYLPPWKPGSRMIASRATVENAMFIAVSSQLAQIAAPELAGYSLDQLAAWTGVDLADRHSALGDAIMAARVFLALVPKLRDHGILADVAPTALQLLGIPQPEAMTGQSLIAHPTLTTP